jgi:hypothetical protein
MTESNQEGPRSATVFVANLAEGACAAQLSEELHELARTMQREAYSRDTKVKGELTLKLRFVAKPNGVVDVEYKIKSKAPAKKTAPATLWLTDGGNLVNENPRQMKLPIREVPRPAPVREIGSAPIVAGTPAEGE